MQQPAADPKQTRIEYLKAVSPFISSIVIAATGFILTAQYNARQLELTRLREISGMLQKLGSDNEGERSYATIGLGLYGAASFPALTALLDDTSQTVRDAAIQSLAVIGNQSIPRMITVFRDVKRSTARQRGGALLVLSRLGADSAFDLARDGLLNTRDRDASLRSDAAVVLGYSQKREAVPLLHDALEHAFATDKFLCDNIAWAFGMIGDTGAVPDLLKLLTHPASSVRVYAIWSLVYVSPTTALGQLPRLLANDTSSDVQSAVQSATQWAQAAQPSRD